MKYASATARFIIYHIVINNEVKQDTSFESIRTLKVIVKSIIWTLFPFTIDR